MELLGPLTAARPALLTPSLVTTVAGERLPDDEVMATVVLVETLASHEVLATAVGAASRVLAADSEPAAAVGLAAMARTITATALGATSSEKHVVLYTQKKTNPSLQLLLYALVDF